MPIQCFSIMIKHEDGTTTGNIKVEAENKEAAELLVKRDYLGCEIIKCELVTD